MPEVAEVWRRNPSLPLFYLRPLPDGAIGLTDPLDYYGEERLPTLDAALSRVVAIEEND